MKIKRKMRVKTLEKLSRFENHQLSEEYVTGHPSLAGLRFIETLGRLAENMLEDQEEILNIINNPLTNPETMREQLLGFLDSGGMKLAHTLLDDCAIRFVNLLEDVQEADKLFTYHQPVFN